MAMTDAGMSAAIKSGITGIPGITISNTVELTAFCNAIGAAVVNYIQANQQATPGTFAVTPSLIIAPSGGGPCSGSGAVSGLGGAQ